MKQKETILEILSVMRNCMLNTKKMLTVPELAAYSGLSISHIHKLTMARQLPHYKPGGKIIFFKRTEIDDWLLKNPILSKAAISLPIFNDRTKKIKSKREISQ